MTNPIQRIRSFYEETVQEVKKCTWPTRPELAESTIVVISTVIILSLFVMVVDNISQFVIQFIITL